MKRMKDEKTSLVTESGSHEDDCDESVPKGWKISCAETPGGPSHQSVEGAPLQQINTRAPGHYCQDDEEVPEGWKEEEEMDYIDNDVPKGCQIRSAEAPGGQCHQSGEGAPLQQINTWAPGQNCQDDEYEGWKIFPKDGNQETNIINTEMSNRAVLYGDENSVVDPQEHVESPGGPGHQYGVGAPLHQINTRACDLSDRSKKLEERKRRRGKFHLPDQKIPSGGTG